MNGPVVAITGLTKRYGDVLAVDDLSLTVPNSSVFGLLGPNGAGKTTIIGMLLGLIRPDAGRMSLFGEVIDGPADKAARRIGAVMETPAFYPYLSARTNLRYFQMIMGREDPGEIERLLELVGLADRGNTRFATFSLGMKHRLGIAYALLGEPPLLLLDEPTNGLDPAGMAEVRQLIVRLGDGERTIVLASHLLHEVEQVCDSVAILSKGRVIAEGAVGELIGRQNQLLVRTTDDGQATQILDRLDWVGAVVPHGDGLIVNAKPECAADVSSALASRQVFLKELRALDKSLEEYFLQVTGDDEAEA